MKTAIGVRKPADMTGPAMAAIRKQFRRLSKAQRTVDRKVARAAKRLEREQYEWASLGY